MCGLGIKVKVISGGMPDFTGVRTGGLQRTGRVSRIWRGICGGGEEGLWDGGGGRGREEKGKKGKGKIHPNPPLRKEGINCERCDYHSWWIVQRRYERIVKHTLCLFFFSLMHTRSVFYEKTTAILFSFLSGYKEAKITHVVCFMKGST